MRLSVSCSVFLALSSILAAQSEDCAPASSQAGNPINPVPVASPQAALGTLLQGPIDVMNTVTTPPTPGTAWNRELGCARGWGYYWVSGGAGATGAFAIHQYTTAGVFVQSFTQTVFSATAWGARDLAVDESNFKLWGGMEGNVLAEYTFNPGGGPNGTLTFTTSYTIPAGPGTVRALARNHNNGHFFSKNFNGSLYEFTISPLAMVSTFGGNGKST